MYRARSRSDLGDYRTFLRQGMCHFAPSSCVRVATAHHDPDLDSFLRAQSVGIDEANEERAGLLLRAHARTTFVARPSETKAGKEEK